MKSSLVVTFMLTGIMLAGCARAEPTPDAVALEATVAQRIFATLTASAPTATTIPTAAPTSTSTSAVMPAEAPATQIATDVPPTDTPVPPTPTATSLLPTPTDTSVPATPTLEGPLAAVKSQALNIRAGPGTSHAIVSASRQGELLQITGRNEDSSWLEVALADGRIGWVSASLVEPSVATNQIALAETIPTAPPAPPTASPVPQATAAPVVAARDLEVDCQQSGHRHDS